MLSDYPHPALRAVFPRKGSRGSTRRHPRQIRREVVIGAFEMAEVTRLGHFRAETAIDALGAALVFDVHLVEQRFQCFEQLRHVGVVQEVVAHAAAEGDVDLADVLRVH